MTSQTTHTQLELPSPGAYRVDSGRSSVQASSRNLFGLRPCSAVFRVDAGLLTVADPSRHSTVFAHLTLVSSQGPRPLPRRRTTAAARPVTATFGSAALHRDRHGWILHGDLHAGATSTHVDLAISELAVRADGLRLTAAATFDVRPFGALPGWPRSRRRLTVDVELAAVHQPLAR